MTETTARKPREIKSEKIRQDMPACKIVQKFGGLSAFCRVCDFNVNTVQGWMIHGLIPARFRKEGPSYQQWILTKALEHDIPLAPYEFFDQPIAA